MKKVIIIIGIVFTFLAVFLSFGYKKNVSIKAYYNVYLDNELLGTIKSKDKLEKYIDDSNKKIKSKYEVDQVYSSTSLHIEKINSYYERTISIESMYNKIAKKSSFTIKGCKITIKSNSTEKDNVVIYVKDKDIFEEAVVEFIKTYVGEEEYDKYINDNQNEIEDTGSIIKNIYIDENITVKDENISVDELIYTDSKELAKFLVFGTVKSQKKYIVKDGDSLDDIAFNNQVSVNELIISNPKVISHDTLLYTGQAIVIGVTNPQLSVVVESYVVEDRTSKFTTEERTDEDKYKGYYEVVQQGKNGVDRVTQNVKSINNYVTYVEPVSIKQIEAPTNKIIVKGGKYAPNIGDSSNWIWPTQNGWIITDEYGYRIHPISGERAFHYGIDISGTGYGSKIYAANNGTVEVMKWGNSYGYNIIINHNNGYWTLYAHLSRFANISVGSTVVAGQVIGYMGSTGDSTGPHLHFEVSKGSVNNRISPWSIYD